MPVCVPPAVPVDLAIYLAAGCGAAGFGGAGRRSALLVPATPGRWWVAAHEHQSNMLHVHDLPETLDTAMLVLELLGVRRPERLLWEPTHDGASETNPFEG